jgi:hypothetical protein
MGVMSGSHAVRHPSQPNYLEFYSGNNQGTIQDRRPGTPDEPFTTAPPFTTPNLGAALRNSGYNFATYSKSLPYVSYDGDSYTTVPGQNQYERKHNPVANWMNDSNPTSNQLPPSVNQPFTAFQDLAREHNGFARLPTVSYVVPKEQHDMHDGTVAQADARLKTNILDTYLPWANSHHSLLIVTFDEDSDDTATNLIPTIFAGAWINAGNYTEANINFANPYIANPGDPGIQTPTYTAMNHYNVLATIEDIYGLEHIGSSVARPGVTDVFTAPPPHPWPRPLACTAMLTTNVSRRKFIGVAAGAEGALALGDVTPLFATSLPSPAHSGISHIIVVMMENRSFDHFLGWLPSARERQSGLTYYDSNGIAHPTYALATNTSTGNYHGCGLVDSDHSFEGGRVEYNNGACDGWRKQGANPSDDFSIGYYTQGALDFFGRAYATVETSTSRSGSAITVVARTFWNPLRTVDATTSRPSYRCGRHRDFFSLVRERIEVRVINLRKAAYKHDSTPHPPPLLDRGGEVNPIGHSSLPLETAAEAVALQILFRPRVDAIERFFDVLDRVSHAKAKITFAEVAERGAGQCSDACVIKERVRQLFRWPSGLRDIREDIESAMWDATGETFDLVQAGNHDVSPFLEFNAHRIHRVLRTAQRLDPGDLCEAGGARVRICH